MQQHSHQSEHSISIMNHDHSQSFNSGISIRQSPSDPMEEWSSIPEFPLAAELNPPESSNSITAESQRYVLQNDVRYPYASKEQYLETHYRLNREEAIAFLRLGIAEYKRDPYMSDNENTFIYTRVGRYYDTIQDIKLIK